MHEEHSYKMNCMTAWQAYQVLEHKEELVVLSDDLLELHHTRVVEFAEGLDLTQRHALLPAKELALHLLDGHLQRLLILSTGWLIQPQLMQCVMPSAT